MKLVKPFAAFLSTFLLTWMAQAEDSLPQHCHLDPSSQTTEYIPIPGQPNFFFRAFPQSRLISYASDEGNYILDMDSHQRFKLPGAFDPVPMGETVITVPDYEIGLTLYSVQDIMNGQSSPQPLHISKNLKGVYQSIGLVEKNKNHEIYAVIVASSTGTLYQKLKLEGLKVSDEGPVYNLCPQVDIKLPMLSKDGKEISGVDGETGVSKIWKINLEDSSCEEVDNLGTSAGKADFSHDGRELIFHMRGDGLSALSYFSRVNEQMNMNVYAYNRDTKTIHPVTQSRPGDNSYFPVYREDGSIVYAVVDRAGIAQFAKVHPKNVKSKALNFTTLASSENLIQKLAIGHVWQISCSGNLGSLAQLSVESLLGTTYAMNQKQCILMIEKSFDEDMKLKIMSTSPMRSRNQLINYEPLDIATLQPEALIKVCKEL